MADIKKDGGPAVHGSFGMSLRDWMAGQALAGIIAAGKETTPRDIAEEAYDIADAMLEVRGE